MNAKLWHGSVRDAFFQTVRRAPAQQVYNGDSLRRVVLQRNALNAASEPQGDSGGRFPARGMFTETKAAHASAADSKQMTPDRFAPKGSTAKNDAAAAPTNTDAPQLSFEERESMWFESLLDELSLDDAAAIEAAEEGSEEAMDEDSPANSAPTTAQDTPDPFAFTPPARPSYSSAMQLSP